MNERLSQLGVEDATTQNRRNMASQVMSCHAMSFHSSTMVTYLACWSKCQDNPISTYPWHDPPKARIHVDLDKSYPRVIQAGPSFVVDVSFPVDLSRVKEGPQKCGCCCSCLRLGFVDEDEIETNDNDSSSTTYPPWTSWISSLRTPPRRWNDDCRYYWQVHPCYYLSLPRTVRTPHASSVALCDPFVAVETLLA